MSSPRVVITGLGAVSPLGLTSKQLWQGICEGACGIAAITAFDPIGFPCKIAGQVPPFKVNDFVPKSSRKAVKLMSRDIELSVVAALEAITQSGLKTKGIDPENVAVNPERMGINLGAGLISCDLAELAPAAAASIENGSFDIHKWGTNGLPLVTPLWLLKYLPNMLPCHIGLIHDIQGPSNTITCGESAALIAVGEAVGIITRGSADIMVAGGAEAKVNPILIIRQILLNRATTQNNDTPSEACRPFDADAKGSVFGEGAGILVLENLEHASARSADILAEVAGFGQSSSINPDYQNIESDGKGIAIAIQKALADAEITPDQLDLVIPHGTGIPHDDAAESNAIGLVLGDAVHDVPVFAPKSMLSNTGAASGALDIVLAVNAIRDGVIPASKNFRRPNGCRLNINQNKITKDIKHVLCCSYTYGGQTAAMVLKKYNG